VPILNQLGLFFGSNTAYMVFWFHATPFFSASTEHTTGKCDLYAIKQ